MPRVRRTTADGNCVESMLTYSAKLKEGQFRVGRRAVGGLPSGRRTFADLKQPNLLGVSLFQIGGVQTRLENPRRFLMKLPWDPLFSPESGILRGKMTIFFYLPDKSPTKETTVLRPKDDREELLQDFSVVRSKNRNN